MMSDPTTVDGTTVDELTGKLVLLIEEPRAWDEPARMHRELAAKVKNYVRHIRGPNYDHPPSETIVRLVSTLSPAPASFDFFSRVSYELSKHGVSFEHQVGEDGLPVPIAPEESATPATTPTETYGGEVSSDVTIEERQVDRRDTAAKTEASTWEPTVDLPPTEEESVAEAPMVDTDGSATTEPSEDDAEGVWEVETPDLEAATAEGEPRDIETSGVEPPPDQREEWELEEELGAEEPLAGPAGLLPDFGPQDEAQVEELVSHLESLARPTEERPKYPPFFPEEEFGRAVPERELGSDEGADIEFIDPDADTVTVEMGARKRVPVTTPQISGSRLGARPNEDVPNLSRALGSALASAAAGAVAWGLLAIPAGHGAGFLSLVVGLMVGMSVRIRGRHTRVFGVLAGVVTLLGSVVGAILATCVLTMGQAAAGLSAVAALFADPGAFGNALSVYFGWVDLAFVAVAVYIAVRLAEARRR